jgi:hypothetical protein
MTSKRFPQTFLDFQKMKEKQNGSLTHEYCIACGEDFSNENTFTAEGWCETQISGMCENCFENLFDSDN